MEMKEEKRDRGGWQKKRSIWGEWEQRVRESEKNSFIKPSPVVRYSLIIMTLKTVKQNFPCILSLGLSSRHLLGCLPSSSPHRAVQTCLLHFYSGQDDHILSSLSKNVKKRKSVCGKS